MHTKKQKKQKSYTHWIHLSMHNSIAND